MLEGNLILVVSKGYHGSFLKILNTDLFDIYFLLLNKN